MVRAALYINTIGLMLLPDSDTVSKCKFKDIIRCLGNNVKNFDKVSLFEYSSEAKLDRPVVLGIVLASSIENKTKVIKKLIRCMGYDKADIIFYYGHRFERVSI